MKRLCFLFVACSVVVWGCQSGGGESTPPADSGTKTTTTTPTTTPGGEATFASANEVIAKNCVGCHGADNPKAGVQLTDYDHISKNVTPGDPASSKIVQLMRGTGGKVMPPNKPLPDAEIKKVEDWIKAGAKS